MGREENEIVWPHHPPHYLNSPGVFMVTAGTYRKEHVFRSREQLRMLSNLLLDRANEAGWRIQAWAVFSNHYHFVGASPDGSAASLSRLIGDVHRQSAVMINRWDGAEGRKVWYNYWEKRLTYERSYLARLAYVQRNPVKHGLVKVATEYPWCSASWFAKEAPPALQRVVDTFKTDRIADYDDF
ncbi:REP-associated tyrosine transposase [Sulfuriroseicoccus oceanibius]|uniref:Transposase n=1 Tax=Sulfuriroseicoccus oceanibius TaxID=2707525 RepID=A0A6B3L628_9BACT|nr:transposase [Sulfuriroseicoccus oceanibius]QQL44446.1 transposase [Sulfuriroseicoccus oceanibius]